MNEPIRGKVAQVLDDIELVFNIGTSDGVTVGMTFDILDTIQIKDPDTSKVLGKITRPRISFEVFEVQEKLSVAFATEKQIIPEKSGVLTTSLLSSGRALVRVGEVVVQSSKEK